MGRMQRVQAQMCRAITASVIALMATAMASITPTANAAPITPGNLVVLRVGTGSAALSSAATAVFLEEYTTAGTFVQQIAVPTTTSGPNRRLTVSGTATSEALLTLSPNSQFLCFAGYDAAPGLASVSGTNSVAVNRVIGSFAVAAGTLDTTTTMSDGFNAASIRTAVTDDGIRFWTGGGTGGVRFSSLGGTTTTVVSNTVGNIRHLSIFNDGICDRMYISSASSTFFGLNTMIPCLPTTGPNTAANIASFNTFGVNACDFFFANPTTAYVADDRAPGSGGGIQKWSFNGVEWLPAYTLNSGLSAGCRGLSGYVDGGGNAVLFATTATGSANSVVTVTDTGASSPVVVLSVPVTAPTNTVFRGIRYIPAACTAPSIDSQSGSVTVCAGQPAAFSVSAGGTAPLTYQWRHNGIDIGGATSSSYNLAAASVGDAGSYDCVITNACGSTTSTAVSLVVNTPPQITGQPNAMRAACPGGSAGFAVTVSSPIAVTYQWRHNGNPVPGATDSGITLAGVNAGDAGSYECVITNACGSVTSSAGNLTVLTPASISGPPQPVAACVGQSAGFSVSANGSRPLSYQWLKDGSPIDGATGASYSIPAVGAGDAGSYSCTVTNDCASQTSTSAALTVNVGPTVTDDPVDYTTCAQGSASFSVTASGTGPLSYQWRHDGLELDGENASTLLLTNLAAGDSGEYDCVVGNACSTVISEAATLTVRTAPLIDVDPVDATVCLGSPATLTVTASGDGPFTYQWRRGGLPLGNGGTISGANSAMLTISATTAIDFDSYDVVVGNECQTATSSPATIDEDLTDVNNNSIPDCQETLNARLSLELAPGSECAQPGKTVQVQVWMRDLGAFQAAGFQAFLNFDAGKLTLVSGTYTSAPFGLAVITPIVATGGDIDLSSGINQLMGQTPTNADSLLATLTFTANNVVDCSGTAVTFRTHVPPSRITALGGVPLAGLTLEDSLGIRIDGVDPVITGAPVDAIVQCGAVSTAPTTLPASDNCDLSVTQATYDGQVIAPGPCPQSYTITRSWSVTDSCGNTAMAVQTITVQDTTAPVITGAPGPITVECDSIPSAPPTLPASDNCDGTVMQATYAGQSVTAGSCAGNLTITRTWTATDACGNSGSATQVITVIDTTAPVISDTPGPIAAECSTIPPAAPFLPASDNCDPSVKQAMFSGSTITAGSCLQSYTLTYTWTATDSCGNSSSVTQAVTVQDTVAPIILGAPSDTTVECDDVPLAAVLAASDACDPTVTMATYDGEIVTPRAPACPGNYSIFRSWTATDACGNSSSASQTITVQDTTAPLFVLPCPLAPIVVNADAGGCTASASSVNAVAPNATDNCDAAPSVTGVRSDNLPLAAAYPQGDTTITWTAADACGNSDTCTQLVTVNPFNTLAVSVQLSPTTLPTISRCITFDIYACPSAVPVTVKKFISFTNGLAVDVSVDVPCGSYSCIIARDELHTLARRDDDDFGVSGANYVADFTSTGGAGGSDDDILTNGNLNNDQYIDILDFGVFASQWQMALLPSGCLTSLPHSDISGNGVVGTDDFTFIQINFLDLGDDPCCIVPPGFADGGAGTPITDISVAELWTMGLGQLMSGDVNDDGRLNQLDIVAMLQGAQPQPMAVFEANESLSWFDPTNWSNGQVPGPAVRVFVPELVLIDGPGASAQRITVMNGGTLRLVGDVGGAGGVGNVNVGPGSLTAGEILVHEGGSLLIDDGASLMTDVLTIQPGPSSARVDWSGELVVDGVTHVVSGAAPHSPAPLAQQPTGQLTVGLHGAAVDSCDRLVIDGQVQLRGTLNVTIDAALTVQAGQRWMIIEADGVLGAFTALNVPTLPAGLALDVQYTPTAVWLVARNGGASEQAPPDVDGVPSPAAPWTTSGPNH